MNSQEPKGEQLCYFFQFGLIVTGKGEREHLTKLFSSLMESQICNFQVIRFIGQRSPITSNKRTIKMVGSGKIIPNEDEKDIGLPARRYLSENSCAYVLLIDDLEYDRTDIAQQVFDRYRKALDIILKSQKYRASVHFLVNMLEAYYFAHAEAINAVLGTSFTDFPGDVESIRHPKNDLKKQYFNFDEIEDGGKILELLDLEQVLDQQGRGRGRGIRK